MSLNLLGRVMFGLALAAGAGSAYALSVHELQQLLRSAPAGPVQFHELRESPWLATPVESRGTMRVTPDGLEKRIASPQQETWRLLPDRMEWVGAGGVERKQIRFSEAPALAALSNALRLISAGELLVLEQSFRLEPSGDALRWEVRLLPRDAEIARHLDHLEIKGSGAHLQVIIIVEREGQRTTTRLRP